MPVNPKSGKSYTVKQVYGGEWHIYADGRQVWVPTQAGNKPGAIDPQQVTSAWLAKGNQPTQQMIDAGLAPAAAPAAPAPPSDPTAPDAQYLADQAQAEFQRNQQRQQLDTQETYDRQDFATALQRMASQKPRDEQTTRQNANKQGLLFSGQLGKNLGDLSAQYAQKQGDNQQSFDRRQAARDAARRALEGGATVDQAAALAALADRHIASDTAAADAGYLVPNPVSPGVTQATGAKPVVAKKKAVTTTGFNKKRGQRYQTVSYGGKTFHVYKTGKPIPVRPRR